VLAKKSFRARPSSSFPFPDFSSNIVLKNRPLRWERFFNVRCASGLMRCEIGKYYHSLGLNRDDRAKIEFTFSSVEVEKWTRQKKENSNPGHGVSAPAIAPRFFLRFQFRVSGNRFSSFTALNCLVLHQNSFETGKLPTREQGCACSEAAMFFIETYPGLLKDHHHF
jgi:hypothetical protein